MRRSWRPFELHRIRAARSWRPREAWAKLESELTEAKRVTEEAVKSVDEVKAAQEAKSTK